MTADIEARLRRAEELARILPGVSADEIARGVDRWCSRLGPGTSMGDVARGAFADLRIGLGYGFSGASARV